MTADGFGPPPGQPTLRELDEQERAALRRRVAAVEHQLIALAVENKRLRALIKGKARKRKKR